MSIPDLLLLRYDIHLKRHCSLGEQPTDRPCACACGRE